MKKSVSKEFRDYCLERYPALKESESYRRMFRYLCFSIFYDKKTNLLCVPKIAIMNICDTSNSAFSAIAFLESFRKNVLPGLQLAEYEYVSDVGWEGKCRQVLHNGFDAEMAAMLTKEIQSDNIGNVGFVNGLPYNRAVQAAYRERLLTEHNLAAKDFALNPSQQKIYDYMHAVGSDRFVRKLNENIDAVRAVIATLPPHKAVIQERIISSIREAPKILYAPSRDLRTSRLHNVNDSAIGFKKEVRKAYSKGWSEVDLRCSQFAILATILDAKVSKAFLETGQSLWQYLHTSATGELTPPSSEQKSVYKAVIYSICFGKGKKNLVQIIRENNITPLFKNEILNELLALREKWFAEIRAAGHTTDAWGNRINVAADRWVGAVAAAKIQSIELEIISGIFDVANEHGVADAFTICMFQHDGATISFNSTVGKERAFRKMQKAVVDKAAQYNVNTILEIEDL